MDNATASMLGSGIGFLLACLPIYLIGLLVGLGFKSKDPDERAMYAAMIAWVTVFFLSAWGFSNGGSLRWEMGLAYIPASIIAFFLLRRHYRRSWVDDD